jgi:hypothetical protein
MNMVKSDSTTGIATIPLSGEVTLPVLVKLGLDEPRRGGFVSTVGKDTISPGSGAHCY